MNEGDKQSEDRDRPQYDLGRDAALVAGQFAERIAAVALDRIENLTLWMQQEGLSSAATSQSFHDIGPALQRLRQRALPLPHQLGQIVAGSTYFAVKMALHSYQTAVTVLDEATRLVAEKERQE